MYNTAVLYSAIAVGGLFLGSAIVLPAIGFGVTGVSAGSIAATLQSTVYGSTVASSSAFAVAQSVGAAGFSATTYVAAGIGAYWRGANS